MVRFPMTRGVLPPLFTIVSVLAFCLFSAPALAGPMERISVNANGEEANGESGSAVASRDGRYIVFASAATNLVEGDANSHPDVFLKDRETGEVELISVATDGTQGDGWSGESFGSGARRMDVTPNGRFVVFESEATNLTPATPSSALTSVFLRDREMQTTELISFSADGTPSSAFTNGSVAVSDDGNLVLYLTGDASYDTGADVTFIDALVHNRVDGSTSIVNLNDAGEQSAPGGNANSNNIVLTDITGDGRFVVFHTRAPNLVDNDTNDAQDVFLRDLLDITTQRVSVASDGTEGDSVSEWPSIGANGRYVLFRSRASTFSPNAEPEEVGLYVHDLQDGTVQRLAMEDGSGLGTVPAMPDIVMGRNISADGRFVVFGSSMETISENDANDSRDVFRIERATGEITLLSEGLTGSSGNGDSSNITISEDGRIAVFESDAGDLVEGDTNGVQDIFATGDVLPGAHPYEYAAKFVCGDQRNPEQLILTQGRYATTVNIHNPKPDTAAFSKKLALSIPPGMQQPGKILPIDTHELAYDEALAVDCEDIRTRLFPGGFPGGMIEGFLVLESAGPLDVYAVYTTAALPEDGAETIQHSSIDVERVPERTRRADLAVNKSAFVLPLFEVSDTLTYYLALYSITLSNAGPDTVGNISLRDELVIDQVNALALGFIAFEAIELPSGAVLTGQALPSLFFSSFDVDLNELAAGETAVINFGALLLVNLSPELDPFVMLRDTVSVTSTAADPNPDNDSFTLETVIVP